MAERRFLSDIMHRIARAGFSWADKSEGNTEIVELCATLIGEEGEALALARAQHILARLQKLTEKELLALFLRVSEEFGPDENELRAAIERWTAGDVDAARQIHFTAEPKSQSLIRTLNMVPEATAKLVNLRARLLNLIPENEKLKGLDTDFKHLFSSWFNRGFLEVQRIDWSETPAEVLEKIIDYEAVHQIAGWDDLRQRVADPDRRLFAFFHPAMPAEPLIFVEVVLTIEIPTNIQSILNVERELVQADTAACAVFYSISNCQKGLRGISFGSFLIKQVVAELQRELPNLKTFVTLSPVPALRKWAGNAVAAEGGLLDENERAKLLGLKHDQSPSPSEARHIAALYLTNAKRAEGIAYDPVAHFHLGNGAVLHRAHAEADFSERGFQTSWGVMVNYLYDDGLIETNHQAYATTNELAVSAEVRALAAR